MLKRLHCSHTTFVASESVDSTTEKSHECEILAIQERVPRSGGDRNDSIIRK